MARVWQGAVAPEGYSLDVTPGVASVDLSTVSAQVFNVKKPDGTTTTWACSRTNQTASTLTLTHTFVGADVTTPGSYVVYAALTIPAGTVRTKPRVLVVKPTYEWT